MHLQIQQFHNRYFANRWILIIVFAKFLLCMRRNCYFRHLRQNGDIAISLGEHGFLFITEIEYLPYFYFGLFDLITLNMSTRCAVHMDNFHQIQQIR